MLRKKSNLFLLAIYRHKEEGKNGSKLYIKIIEVCFRILPDTLYILILFLFRKRSEAYFYILLIHGKISLPKNEEQNEKTFTFT